MPAAPPEAPARTHKQASSVYPTLEWLARGQASGSVDRRGATRQRARIDRVAAPQAELPGELVRRLAADAHAAAVDAEEVVGGAEADQVPGVVGSSLRE